MVHILLYSVTVLCIFVLSKSWANLTSFSKNEYLFFFLTIYLFICFFCTKITFWCSCLMKTSQQAGDETELLLSYWADALQPLRLLMQWVINLWCVFRYPLGNGFQLIIVAIALLIIKKLHVSLILIFKHKLLEVLVGTSNKSQRPTFGIKT